MKERIYHLGITENPGAAYALLPGDPGRVHKIAECLSDSREIARNREFVTCLGQLGGVRVLVTSTGIGGPSAAIAMEELAVLGVRTFIRVGTCGGMQTDLVGGDLVIPSGAIRMEGTSKEYLPPEFPAVPDFRVLNALEASAAALGLRHRVGVVQSKDSFYGQHEPGRMPVGRELESKWRAFIMGGALASEMECAALFTVAACLHVRAGAVLACVWNQERAKAGLPNPDCLDTGDAVKAAVRAMKLLIADDAAGDGAPQI